MLMYWHKIWIGHHCISLCRSKGWKIVIHQTFSILRLYTVLIWKVKYCNVLVENSLSLLYFSSSQLLQYVRIVGTGCWGKCWPPKFLWWWCLVKKLDFLAVYEINWHFSRHFDMSAAIPYPLLAHIYHYWELLNEVLYDTVSQRMSKAQQVKVENSVFITN